ncbi:MAG: hypothetical protein K2K21_11520 [Lachnospiraceae bacterium]|nr:hypothetical protein [Lachnospiraceae bacterium]
MIQKKPTRRARHTTEESGSVKETIRKSKLTASNEFELKKLVRAQDGFLNCSMEEEKESLIMTYEINNLLPWTGIRREPKELMFSALIDAGRLEQRAQMYRFTLAPENLYYDIQGRVYVKTRDVYGADGGYSQEEFMREYKSLIGCTLIKKYKFEDYDKGGQDLLAEDRFLGGIMECTDVGQILDRLHDEYFHYKKIHEERYVEVSKAGSRGSKIALGIMGVLSAAALAFFGWLFLWERPYKDAVIAANEAYLQSDYNGTVEAMEAVKVERMNVYQKYILAYSCVRCESFSDVNMRNILNTISLNGDEKLMEYWIYINRLDTEKAADIAMQESSDQLLFYAYLKEKAVVENDSSLSGQEKNDRLSDIDNKLKPLKEEFSTLTEE